MDRNKGLFQFLWALICLAVMAALGLGIYIIWRYTNGFNEDFKTFCLTYDGEDIVAANSTMFFQESEVRFDVRYLFDFSTDDIRDYSVHIETIGEPFEFMKDGEQALWITGTDVTEIFGLDKQPTYFTFKFPEKREIAGFLSLMYNGSDCTVTYGSADAYTAAQVTPLFRLVVESYNGKITYTVDFPIGYYTGLVTGQDQIVF